MFFERFDSWGEEKLGLLAGVSIVLIGAFIYLLYWVKINLLTYVPLVLMIISSGFIAYLFQLPRLKNMKSGVATLFGGLMIGVTIVFYAIMGAMENQRDAVGQAIVWSIGALIMILSFFAVGFLLLAVYPEEGALVTHKETPKSEKKEKKEKSEEKEKGEKEEEDFLERIERL